MGQRCAFKKDRMKTSRLHFQEIIASYKKVIGNRTQHEFFSQFIASDSPRASFSHMYGALADPKSPNHVSWVGPHAIYGWLEALMRCVGLPIECDEFRMDGPNSPRKGHLLCLGDYARNNRRAATPGD